MIPYPDLNPVALSLGEIDLPLLGLVHLHTGWINLASVLGFAVTWALVRWRASRPASTWTPTEADELIPFALLGALIGSRLGWCLTYGWDYFSDDPLMLFRLWEGGQSFHGALFGAMFAMARCARRIGRSSAEAFDFLAPLTAPAIFIVHIGNFLQGEVWGKPTEVPWGLVLYGVGRHPVQLYQAALEGLVLFVVMWIFTSRPRPQLAPAGLFLVLCGVLRFGVEFFRLPNPDIGYLAWDWLTMGQLLSIPVIAIGLAMMYFAYNRDKILSRIELEIKVEIS